MSEHRNERVQMSFRAVCERYRYRLVGLGLNGSPLDQPGTGNYKLFRTYLANSFITETKLDVT